MCLSGDGLSCIGSGKTDNGGTGSHSGLQTVEGVFEHVRVFGSSTEYFHTEQETVGSGFGTGKHFSGQDAVYHSFKFGMGVIDVLHLLFVGAGYNGYFCSVFTKIGNKSFYTGDVLVIDQNLKGLEFKLAKCCNPIYGDDVFGFVTVSGGIKIHRADCPNANQMRERFGYRIVKARWAGKSVGTQYPITLRVVGHDDIGIVTNITSIISKENGISLRSIGINSNDGLFSGTLTVMVGDTGRLEALIKKLRTVKGVKQVSRN
jgi:predicted amino acid-binding ACT domain protein